jgi:hypothetical protein
VNWQRALLVVARDALPRGRERRSAEPGDMVDTPAHLGDGGHGAGDEELTTLHRAASAISRRGPRLRGTIGAERRLILLGDVLIGQVQRRRRAWTFRRRSTSRADGVRALR